jgi:phosphoglycerate dehydrogenase-like enzyme
VDKVLMIDPAIALLAPRIAAGLPADVMVEAVDDFSIEELRRRATNATVLVNARRPIDATTLAAAPFARFIQLIGAGYDTIDRAAVAEAGVNVAYNPGVNRTGAAEHTLMLILALLKRMPRTEAMTRDGRFAPGEIIAAGIDDLADATIGLIGMGHIGQAVVERVAPFGPSIVYHTRRPVTEIEHRFGARHVALPDLLAGSNIVSLHVPLGSDTYHLIGAAELALMPAGSYLINTGRGGLVDEEALREAILSGHLAGAGIDVLEQETDGRNPFADLPQVIVTPHLGGGSRNSMANTVERCTANIRRFLAGEPIHDAIA